MQTTELLANPFALMINPAEVFQALERSDRLSRLQSRVCRPLDKPVIARQESDLTNDDRSIDVEADSQE